MNLGNQIKEDHLTCSICLNGFTRPKALPCLHTFCELCLQDYIAGRGYGSLGKFPCPLCRIETNVPGSGIAAFPDNHLVSSLSHTVDQLQPQKPIPKPRRSLGTDMNDRSTLESLNHGDISEVKCSQGPDDFEIVDTDNKPDENLDLDAPPPPYSSVADSHPNPGQGNGKLCSNDTDQGWMVVPGKTNQHPGPRSSGAPAPGCVNSDMIYPGAGLGNVGSNMTPYGFNQTINQINVPSGPCEGHWYSNSFHPAASGDGITYQNQQIPNMQENPNPMVNYDNLQHPSSGPLYPSVLLPTNEYLNTPCAENLILRFGKQGSSPRDFIKPLGLAVSKEGYYIVSDNGGDQNRLLVFNSGGEIMTAFKCGCKVKDITISKNNEIIAAIHKRNSGVRRFTLSGQLKGEFGKFFTFEEPSGIAELRNEGIALTGLSSHCIYILTDQMKLQTKFGRKGNGDGYFSHPGFVTVDSRNHVIVSDKMNDCIQIFSCDGRFKHRFGSSGQNHGCLHAPMGVCTDSADNIIVADSGNFRVEVFTSRGRYLSSVVRDTWQIGENVRPVNVSITPTGKIAILLRGPYFAEVRIYSSRHQEISQEAPSVAGLPLPVSLGGAIPMPKNFGLWPS